MSGYTRVYAEKLFEAIQILPERELRLWLALVAHANVESLCWPSIAALSAITTYRQENVIQLLECLADKGFIQFVRRGERDPLTKAMRHNVYSVDGVVTTEYRADSGVELENGVVTPPRTEEVTKQRETRQETPPPTQQIPSNVEEGKPKNQRKNGKEKTPTQSVIPNTPPQVPATPSRYYRGPLDGYAEPLPGDQEQAAAALQERVDRKLPLRLARKLVVDYGQENVDIALAHLAKQTDVRNPAGYVRALLERQAVEQADAAAADPGLAYISGALKDYIEH